jgi:GTPase SAR1 family protein
MEAIDGASVKFVKLTEEDLTGYGDTVVSEADVRMKIIDRIFVEVLGWPLADIHLETPAGEGFIDYRCTVEGLNRMVIEAKRQGRDLGISSDRSARAFRLNGPVFDSAHAKEGIEQAIRYCGHKNAELACVTNGRQWIVFLGNRRGDGRNTLDGLGFVFGSLDGVKQHFKKFYDLLAYESVRGFRYRAEFQEAEGQPIRSSSFRSPIRKPDNGHLLTTDQLYIDVDRVMLSFFRDLSGDDDPELRRQCFVVSRESAATEENLARISEELRNRIRTLHGDDEQQITQAIRRVLETQRREFVLLVGTKGAGKSTFIERFFADVLPREVACDCVLVRIDLAESGADEHTVISWLDRHFLEAVERAVFQGRVASYEDLQGAYWREYERWREGPYKYLYESDKTAFKIEFGKHVDRRREDRPHDHIVHILHRIVESDKKVPCLVFDNADHFTIEFQERVFQYAHSLYSAVLCLVIVPITDKTSWQLSRQGALQSFFTESFFLPTPSPETVLRKRVEFIEKKLSELAPAERGRGYFFGRGIELSIDNLRAFTNTVQAVFIRTGQVANWIGNLVGRQG